MLRTIRQLGRQWPFSVPATIVGSIVLAYGLAALAAKELGALQSMGTMTTYAYVVCGALDPGEIAGPRPWTSWFTSAFLHGGLIHLIMNSMSILQLGRLLDALTMPRSTLLAYLMGVVGGAAAVMALGWFQGGGSVTIGASSGACGILGALLGLIYRARGAMLAELRRELLTSTAILIAIGFAPGISAIGHAGGLIAGVACGLILRQRGSIRLARDPWTSGPDIAAAVLTFACVLALGISAYRIPNDIKVLKSTKPLSEQIESLRKWLSPNTPAPTEIELRDWINVNDQLKLPRAYVPIMDEVRRVAVTSGLLDGRAMNSDEAQKATRAIDTLLERFAAAALSSGWFENP